MRAEPALSRVCYAGLDPCLLIGIPGSLQNLEAKVLRSYVAGHDWSRSLTSTGYKRCNRVQTILVWKLLHIERISVSSPGSEFLVSDYQLS